MQSKQKRVWEAVQRGIDVLRSHLPGAKETPRLGGRWVPRPREILLPPAENEVYWKFGKMKPIPTSFWVVLTDPRIPPVIADLEALDQRVQVHLQSQDRWSRGGRGPGQSLAALKDQLRDDFLLPTVRKAKELQMHRDIPGGLAMLRVPPKWATAEAVADYGVQLAKWLKDRTRGFEAAKWKKDFRRELQERSRNLHREARATNQVHDSRKKATAGIGDEIDAARKKLGEADGLLRGPMRVDAKLRTMWESEKRIWGRQGRPKKRRPLTRGTGRM